MLHQQSNDPAPDCVRSERLLIRNNHSRQREKRKLEKRIQLPGRAT